MDLPTRKISFIQEFLNIQNENVVIRLEKALIKEKNKISEKHLQSLTAEEINKRADQSLLDSKNGKLTENNDLSAEISKWA